MGIAEERLVTTDWLALVVKNRPAGADPAWTEIAGRHLRQVVRPQDERAFGVAFGHRSGLSLNLLLQHTAKSIRILEALLDLQAIWGRRITSVRFPGHGADNSRLRLR